MSILHRTTFFALLLLLGLSVPALADVEHIGGYAQANRLYTDGWDGVRFDVMSPFFRVDNALISVTLKVKTKDGKCLKTSYAVCGATSGTSRLTSTPPPEKMGGWDYRLHGWIRIRTSSSSLSGRMTRSKHSTSTARQSAPPVQTGKDQLSGKSGHLT